MRENFIGFLIVAFILGLIGLLVWASVETAKENRALRSRTETEYTECLKHESKYICEAYRNSVYAKMSAESAATSAAISAGFSGAAMGINAGRR